MNELDSYHTTGHVFFFGATHSHHSRQENSDKIIQLKQHFANTEKAFYYTSTHSLGRVLEAFGICGGTYQSWTWTVRHIISAEETTLQAPIVTAQIFFKKKKERKNE